MGSLLAVCAACASPTRTPVPTPNATEGIALHGYDPVAYFALGEPTRGSSDYEFEWQGVTYRFASSEHRERFTAEPERYLPQYGGYCAIAMAWNRIADVDPESWAIVDDKLYLNASPFAHGLWFINRTGHIESADENWAEFPRQPIE